jgi:hypothetical protein
MATSHDVTLLEVFQTVREVAADEQETLATMVHLLTSGQVRLSNEAIRAMKDLQHGSCDTTSYTLATCQKRGYTRAVGCA